MGLTFFDRVALRGRVRKEGRWVPPREDERVVALRPGERWSSVALEPGERAGRQQTACRDGSNQRNAEAPAQVQRLMH